MSLDRHVPKRVGPLAMLTVAVLVVGLAGCAGPFPQTVFEPTTSFGESADRLFMVIFWFAVVVFVVVEGVLLITLIRFRARPGQPAPKEVHGHTALEIAWTLAPAWIIALIAVPAIQTIWEEAAPPPDDALTVHVIGHQWWWEYRYPEYGIVTANELHLPMGRPVVLEMTSADVIHSWWAPRIGGKRDVIAGHTTRLSFVPDTVGVYLGQCAEYCGTSHANMRMRVFVEAQEDFDAWVAQQRTAPAPDDSLSDLARRGRAVFMEIRTPASNSCLACHAIEGLSAGVLGPNLTHVASRSTIAGGVLANDAEQLARWLRDPAAVKPGTTARKGDGSLVGMPTVGLTDQEIDALVAYLQTLR